MKLRLFSAYLTEKYGKALQRIGISLPLSCPHREKDSGRGCIFCADDGNRSRHIKNTYDIRKQISDGISYARRRYGAEAPYIAYFQSFTNTNAKLETLKKLYEEALSLADFKMLIIATRPDCLPDDVLTYLAELNKRYELWIELGVQSANDKTLELINRGHDFKSVEDAVLKLDKLGIKTAAHIILGLPGETIDDCVRTAEKIAALPFKAVKVHNLMVLRNTPLAKLYADGKFNPWNEYEYADALLAFVKKMPEDMIYMRLTAEADEEEIIAPSWWMKKGQFLEHFHKLLEKGDDPLSHAVKTEDGSYTFYHPEYRQHFHTVAGAAAESYKKFVEPSGMKERLAQGENLSILDIGFGLGYNALAAISTAEEIKSGSLELVSLEKDLKTLDMASALPGELHKSLIDELRKKQSFESSYSKLELLVGDARSQIKSLTQNFDYIFLDAFSPESNPELWTYDFIRILKRLLKKDGMILTYSAAFPVRGAMLRCGLNVRETEAFGRRKGGTVAINGTDKSCGKELPEKEIAIIKKSTAGLPYRDPDLNSTREKILKLRESTVAELRARGIPKWFKG